MVKSVKSKCLLAVGIGIMSLPSFASTKLDVGGYAKMDMMCDSLSKGKSDPDTFQQDYLLASTIPVTGDTHNTNFNMHGKESRFWIKTTTPLEGGDLKGHIEMDFYGRGASDTGIEITSNSMGPRLRHFYGTYRDVLVGQTWSNFMDTDSLPEINDFGGPVGAIFARQPQVRWTTEVNGGDLSLALENPELNYLYSKDYTPSGSTTPTYRATSKRDIYPDFSAKYVCKCDNFIGAISGIIRHFAAQSAVGSIDPKTKSTTGGAVSASMKYTCDNGDDIKAVISHGHVGRYMGNGIFEDAYVSKTDAGKMKKLVQTGGFLAYKHCWNDELSSTVLGSIARAKNKADMNNYDSTDDKKSPSKRFFSTHVNLMWNPVKNVRLGMEWIRAVHKKQNDAKGRLNRYQFSAMYVF